MTQQELEAQLADLEELFDEIAELVDDPEVSDSQLRDEVRKLLYEEDDNGDE